MNVTAVTQSVGAAPVTATQKTQDGSSFTDKISNAVKSLDESHQIADSFAGAAATGDLESLTSYVVAATEAQLATQVTVSVRNKAISAFNQIMGMNI